MENNGYAPFLAVCKTAVLTINTNPPLLMKTIRKVCPICNTEFDAPLREINRGNAKVCSRQCGYISSSQKKKKINVPNTECSYCKKLFYKNPSKMCSSKSGLYFCCRKHKDAAQRIDSGFNTMWPSHYKSGTSVKYRKFALEYYGSYCQVCGYRKHPCILQVHHKDSNRTNNKIENLLVCCPNCHMEQHIIDGKFSTRR